MPPHRRFRPAGRDGAHTSRASSPTLLLLTLLLAGCGPHRIDLAPAPLKGGAAHPMGATTSADAARAPWWEAMGGAELDTLIRRALAENFDVVAARERIAQALAAHDRARAGLRPTLEGKLGIDDEAYAGGRARQRTRRRAGASVDWEPDVFGRLNGAREARGAEAWARVHEAEDFRLRLSVDVADTYLGIVEQRWLLDLLDAQMGTANELGRIIAQRYDEGLISQLDVLQQQTQIAELEGQIPVARAALEDLQNRLGALLGALPGDAVVTGAGEGAPLPEIGSLPRLERADELLRRRPDLRASQAALVAADAETARALAERLPRLTLSADALRVETGGGPAIKTISLGAELVQPLLDWGARRAEWVRTKAVYRERLAAFSQDFLGAVWEVEALIQNERRQHELLESLARRRVLLETTIKQARSRYDAGLTDYLPVLSATQQFYAVEQRLVRERRRLASLRVAMHRALGGPAPADPIAPAIGPAPGRATYSLFGD